MTMLKKVFASLLALVMLLTLSAAVAEDNSLQAVLDKGTFIIGLDDSFPPLGYRDENNDIVGFDIDVARAKEALRRAQERLADKDVAIDAKRAEAAVARAMARLKATLNG